MDVYGIKTQNNSVLVQKEKSSRFDHTRRAHFPSGKQGVMGKFVHYEPPLLRSSRIVHVQYIQILNDAQAFWSFCYVFALVFCVLRSLLRIARQ